MGHRGAEGMHPLVRMFVEDAAAAIELPDPVVEFGALQVEPGQDSDLRPLFAGRPFLGTDFRAGPGVDRVEDLRALTFADGEVGTAICLETLEHCEDPIAAGRELARVVADGGACLASAPMLLGIHGYPSDYFRYTPAGLRCLLGGFDAVWAGGFGDAGHPLWVFAVAVKGRELDFSWERLPRLAEAQRRYERAEGQFRVGPLRFEAGELVRIAARGLPRALAQGARARMAGRGR
jgi:SAM-dependent methyltransferase